jgi:two-component system NtrC family sensor kinase
VNLLLNSKDALQDKKSGTIRISTIGTSNGVEMRVEDDGAGMPPEVMRKIYDPFFTTKSTPKDGQRKGTGLGMAVTYGIVQEHAGTIEVTSHLGEGTIFRLEFPAMEAVARRGETSAGAEEGKVVHV